ncbi:hypothetical protein PIB30_057630 [Stylosanthes scabra]|uniref:CCHC-type domain-containing protein n=1 Tax=Stylosanthes scabra TaxID=79078 RepID=A0ABU6ULC1_9FABA|nr:hypothetical protein [Stylosanthes scabra]
MRIWIRAQDVRIWKVIEQGNHIPMKSSSIKVGEATSESATPKLESEYNEDDWKKMSLSDKTFKIKEEEKIEDALERFSKVFNGQTCLERNFPRKRSLAKGNLLTYEMTILDTQGGGNKKKSLTLKASSHEEDSDENEDQDEEFALLLKRFNKFAKKKNFNFKNKNKAPKCYECGEVGHIKPNCPKLQKGEKDNDVRNLFKQRIRDTPTSVSDPK